MEIKRNYMFTAKETPLHEEITYFVYARDEINAYELFRRHRPFHLITNIEKVDFEQESTMKGVFHAQAKSNQIPTRYTNQA